MTYTVVPDKTVGDIFSEVMWDTSIKDNLNKGVWRPIADTLLGSSAASIVLSAIAADYAHLMLLFYGRCDFATNTIGYSVRFNGDAAANYDQQTLRAGGGVAFEAQELYATTAIALGTMPSGNAAANLFSTCWTCFPNYANTTNHKMALSHCSLKWGLAGTQTQVWLTSGFWRSAAAISSLTLLPGNGNLVTGTRATLYGLAP